MIIVDTSAWIEFFRGRGRLGTAVDELLDANEVALCGPIITELYRGIHRPSERAKVIPLLAGCRYLEQPERLWEEAGELGSYLARKGLTVKSMDLLIAIYALSHSVAVLTADSDFELMRRSGLGLQLVEE
jgi:predicted nucleic acid-binding protein